MAKNNGKKLKIVEKKQGRRNDNLYLYFYHLDRIDIQFGKVFMKEIKYEFIYFSRKQVIVFDLIKNMKIYYSNDEIPIVELLTNDDIYNIEDFFNNLIMYRFCFLDDFGHDSPNFRLSIDGVVVSQGIADISKNRHYKKIKEFIYRNSKQLIK